MSLRRWLAAAGMILLLAPGSATALSRGSAGADFLKIANGVRAVAMGGSFAAVGEDIYAVYWNPAGIAHLTAPETAISYVKLYQSDQIDGVYLVTGAVQAPELPFGYGNTAFGFMALATGSFDSTDPQAIVKAAAGSASDLMFFMTYSVPISDALSVGASLKYVRRSLTGADPDSYQTDPATGDSIPTRSQAFHASGAGGDLGILWENIDRTLSIGGSIQNLGEIGRFGESFSFDFGGGEILPITFRLGSAMRFRLWGHQLLATGDLSSFVDSIGDPRLSLGAEYALAGFAFFRLGWEQPLDQPIGRTALDFGKEGGLASLPSPMRSGLGFRWKFSPSALMQFDYALAPFGTLGSVHHAAMLVRWDIPKTVKAITAEAPVQVEKKTVRPVLTIEPKQLKVSGPVKEWKIDIVDDRGRVVKTMAGTGPQPKTLDWDGTDDRGKVVTNVGNLAKFKFVPKVVDIRGKTIEAKKDEITTLATVTAEPQIKPVAGKPLYPEVVFVLPQGSYQLWQLQIQDAGRLVRTWQGQGKPDTPLVWDGRDAQGKMAKLAAPKYAWSFKDEAGQTQTGEQPLPQIEADIKPEPMGNRVRMVGVRYVGAATALNDEHRVVLRKAAQFVAEHPGASLTIEGYADVPGDDDANYDVAKTRAERVLRTLVEEYSLNAARVRMIVYGRSKTAPRYPNIPEAEQGQRVDLVINVAR